jgi:hypothetical protein
LTGKECEEENADKPRDRVGTEPIETMGIFRMYAGPDGKSHLEEQALAEHPLLTKPQAAKLIVFAEQPAGTFLDWHPAPRRQYVIVVSGQLEIGLGDGTLRRFGPGDARLVEDTTGQGHTTRYLGPGPVITATIPLA